MKSSFFSKVLFVIVVVAFGSGCETLDRVYSPEPYIAHEKPSTIDLERSKIATQLEVDIKACQRVFINDSKALKACRHTSHDVAEQKLDEQRDLFRDDIAYRKQDLKEAKEKAKIASATSKSKQKVIEDYTNTFTKAFYSIVKSIDKAADIGR